MRRGPLHAHVAAAHGAALVGVEDELELTLEHDAVVDGHGAVERGFDPGAEVDDAHHGAVCDVEAWLCAGFAKRAVSAKEFLHGFWGGGDVLILFIPGFHAKADERRRAFKEI